MERSTTASVFTARLATAPMVIYAPDGPVSWASRCSAARPSVYRSAESFAKCEPFVTSTRRAAWEACSVDDALRPRLDHRGLGTSAARHSSPELEETMPRVVVTVDFVAGQDGHAPVLLDEQVQGVHLEDEYSSVQFLEPLAGAIRS